jgi:acetate kinase
MTGHVLTLNAGSSSIKFALFDLEAAGDDAWRPDWAGVADGLGSERDAVVRIRDRTGMTVHDATLGAQATHDGALAALLGWRAAQAGALRIAAVGHRVVHGGTQFTEPVAVDDAAVAAIDGLASLAPLHQPHNAAGIRAARQAFGEVPHVACFDTAFHAVQPAVNQRFAIPRRLHDAGIRRYGFHGLSYESIVAQLDRLDPALVRSRVIVAHLGNGASLCALDAGRSVATTMSFSPLDGLTMGTRCGQLDAAVVLHLLREEGMSADAIATLLYRQSGLIGLSGISGDVRELEASTDPAAAEALDHFVEQVVQGIGRMAAALRGIDAIVFTGGIGENAATLRERMVRGCAWLGAELDAEANRHHGGRITTLDSRVAAHVVRTDEEAVIAGHAARVAGLARHDSPTRAQAPARSRIDRLGGEAPKADGLGGGSPGIDANQVDSRAIDGLGIDSPGLIAPSRATLPHRRN